MEQRMRDPYDDFDDYSRKQSEQIAQGEGVWEDIENELRYLCKLFDKYREFIDVSKIDIVAEVEDYLETNYSNER